MLQTMVVPEEREGKMEDDPDLARGTDAANETTSTRKAGGVPKQKETPKVQIYFRLCVY